MSGRPEAREFERLRALKREYEAKGYSVVEPRGPADLPSFLRDSGYFPDLIVDAGDRRLVIEIKSAGTAHELDRFSKVADRVNAEPNWEFVLVMTNPRRTTEDNVDIDATELRTRIHHIQKWRPADQTQAEARLVLAWSTLEAGLRLALATQREPTSIRSGHALVREAAMLGLIDRKAAASVSGTGFIRNRLVHGFKAEVPADDEVEKLLFLALEVLDLKADHTDV